MRKITPRTENQERMFKAWNSNNHICAHGSAGSGKTFLSMYLALNSILDGDYDKLIIVRSILPTRDVGFLPGSLEEKIAIYENPYRDILHSLSSDPHCYDHMKDDGVIEFVTTSFIRGLTWDKSIILVDEGENLNWHEIDSVMTRVGLGSRVMFIGDMVQTDLTSKTDKSGMSRFLRVIDRMSCFDTIVFGTDDIVRSEFVKSWIINSMHVKE